MKNRYLSMKLNGRRYSALKGTLALDGFHLKDHLGQGRFGVCYTVSRDNTDYVFKIFNANDVKRRKEKLARESRWLKKIDHLAIPKLIQIVDRDGFYGLIMEKLAGNSLAELIEWDYDFKKAEIIAIMTQLIELLKNLNAIQISHGDIKASNILWTGSRLSLIDFGSARHISPFSCRFNLDFWEIGDVFMRLASVCHELTLSTNDFCINQLNLNDAEKSAIKRMLYIEQPYLDFNELQTSFVQSFL